MFNYVFLYVTGRLMGQYCFASWRLLPFGVVGSVTLPDGGPAGRMGGRAADTARRASTITSS